MKKGYDTLGLYHDADDPRLIVPKRNPLMGWTINVAHRRGQAMLAGIAVFIVAAVIHG